MTSSSISLREAAPNDLDAILKIFEECIDVTAVNDYSEEQRKVWKSSIRTPEKWLKRIEEQEFWLATDGKNVAGFASLKNSQYIDCMYVSPRFQSQGIAQLLLDQIESLAKDQGIRVLSSDVSHTARGFFEKNGYAVVRPNEIEKEGVVLVNFHVEKVILGLTIE